MLCQWKELLAIIPIAFRQEVDRLGKESAQEFRLRLDKPPELIMADRSVRFIRPVTMEDLNYVVNTACQYSPWTASSAYSGYITANGGHRIGICGDVIHKDGIMAGFRTIRSLNIRIARDFPGIGKHLAGLTGNILLIGKPGSGKTTLLRDIIRFRSQTENVSVVDERGELFPQGLSTGYATDIITGCTKAEGIETVLRTMGPASIAVDEITAAADCDALVQAGWCGVRVLATVHGTGLHDLRNRRIYKAILDSGLFDTLVILRQDKSYRTERITL